MNKAEALHQFWSSFSLTAIDENSAYDKSMDLPENFISYEVRTDNIEGSVALTANLWYRSTSWQEISQKADEIASYIGYGGKVFAINGGYMWVKLGSPFSQRILVEDDVDIRRISINITVDFLTAV